MKLRMKLGIHLGHEPVLPLEYFRLSSQLLLVRNEIEKFTGK